ncbi:MAG: DUF2007 domain-containing protein [Aquabacterium sp.]|uniref:putative signal transducing protein n=1 Tax=Aquabacterium sp. TaxID=1872578 RepID=UPI002721B567|nr:DUF2007 domain-containing protein [Aquabacterium sp.]MDO9004320.1 DUF2007 domain-containing protein [Aquabacterium sp.]
MKTVYNAANVLEAQMLLDVLRQEGITAHLRGAYLQGAMGELPAAGLVRLEVAEEDHLRAREAIDRWEAASPVPDTPVGATADGRGGRSRWALPALGGLALGVALSLAFMRAPASTEGRDNNGDGVLDERWRFSASGRHLSTEVDHNFDQRIDSISTFDGHGQLVRSDLDEDFDGVKETRIHYKRNNPELAEVDLDGDGVTDVRTLYRDGVAHTVEYVDPITQKVARLEHLRLGSVVSADMDTDGDGRLDTTEGYSRVGAVTSRVPMAGAK